MKALLLAIPLIFLTSCSSVPVEKHTVGTFAVYIASVDDVNNEYQEVCFLEGCGKKVKGFINHVDREIWASDQRSLVDGFRNMLNSEIP